MFTIRLSDEEFRRVAFLSDHTGLTRADLIRFLMKVEARRIELEGMRGRVR